MDKYSGYPGQGMCADSPMEDILCGRSICSTSALSPAAGPAKRRAATNRLEMKTWAGAGNGPGIIKLYYCGTSVQVNECLLQWYFSMEVRGNGQEPESEIVQACTSEA